MPDVKPIPDGYPRMSPHLSVAGAAEAMDFYTRVLGASDSVLMLGDEMPGGTDPGPRTLGGSPVALFVYVDDVDDVYTRAIDAGSKSVQAPENHFYGDRVAMFDDPFGHRWNIATHVEDVAPDEMERRAAAAVAGG